MLSLSNDLIRQNTMQEFLHAMHIETKDINISSIEGLFCFNSKDKAQANDFAAKLQKAIQGNEQQEAIRQFSFTEILANEIANAVCNDEIDRISCKPLKKQGVISIFRKIQEH